MRKRHRTLAYVAFAAFVSVFIPLDAQGQTAAPEAKATGSTGTVKGRVMLGDGKGLQGIAVVLMPADFTPERKPAGRATTDREGDFVMTNVAAGRYSLQPLAPAYASSDAPGGNLMNRGKVIDLAPGETVENQNITLTRGGVITGRVVDADGKPVIEQGVMVVSAQNPATNRPAAMPYLNQTDDRGVYRIYGLPAGRYLVSVGQDKNNQLMMMGQGDNNRYTRTFHPNAIEAAQAKVIEVTAGGEASGIDITLAPSPKMFEARGRIVDGATGKPVAGVNYGFGTVRPDGRTLSAFGGEGGKSDANGEFRIQNLMPGRYAAVVFGNFQTPSENYSEPAPFEITDGDVSGLVIKMRKGAGVSGVAVLEGASDPALHARLSQLSLSFNVMPLDPKTDALRAPNFSQTQIRPDGSFRAVGLQPGKVQIGFGGYPPQKGFTLLRIEHNGVEVRDVIEVGAGEEVTGVRLRFAYGTSIVRGQVQTQRDGAPAPLPDGARVSVSVRRVGATLPQWGEHAVEIDGRGRFSLDGLAAGEYELTLHGWVPGTPGSTPRGTQLPMHRQNLTVPESGEINLNIVYELTPKKQERTP
jgi:hypothetical protein